MRSDRAPRLEFCRKLRGGLHRSERCYAQFRQTDRNPVTFRSRTVKFLAIISVERVPAELQRRFSRCMDFVARAQPTGEFRPKWKRLVATAIARLRFSLATASSHRAMLKRRTGARR